MYEVQSYYANILMPFGTQAKKVLAIVESQKGKKALLSVPTVGAARASA